MSRSVRCCWKCRQNTWDGQECVHCGAPETPTDSPNHNGRGEMPDKVPAGSVCVCCGDADDLAMVPVDVPWNVQPVCEGCLETYRKNCEPGE